MSHERLIMNLSFKKPISSTLKDRLPQIRDAVRWLVSYCENINEWQPNEENTTLVELIDDTTHWRFMADMAIRIPLPQAVVDRLPQIKDGLRWLKGQADPDQPIRVGVHTCLHQESGLCEEEIEV